MKRFHLTNSTFPDQLHLLDQIPLEKLDHRGGKTSLKLNVKI